MTNKKLAIIGASIVLALAIAAIVLFGIQGSKRNKEIRQQTKKIEQQMQAEQDAREAEKTAHEAELEAEKKAAEEEAKKLEEIAKAIKGPQRENPSGCRHISWSDTEKAWETMPMSKAEILYLAEHSKYGSPVYMGGKVTEIVGTLVIHDIYSPSPVQTIVWLKYKIDKDTEILRTVLLQGEYSCEDIDDLPGGLNYQKRCCTKCILYGGRFDDAPKYVANHNDKCQGRQSNSNNCRDCGGDVGAGDGQGDGMVSSTTTEPEPEPEYTPKERKTGNNW